MSDQTSYPLSWPVTWKRTLSYNRARAVFHRLNNGAKLPLTLAMVVADVYREMRLMGVPDFRVIISTNIRLRLDGLPMGGQAQPTDPGAAVYFTLKERKTVLACDKWTRVEDNLSAIARHVEAIRLQGRLGVGSVEQAFAGYTALPPPGTSAGGSYWDVLGTAHDAPFEVMKEAYRAKARVMHPDNGGSNDQMHVLNHAWDQAQKAHGQK